MHIDTLPPGCEAEFVGEGAANVVFAIKPPKNQSWLQGKQSKFCVAQRAEMLTGKPRETSSGTQSWHQGISTPRAARLLGECHSAPF